MDHNSIIRLSVKSSWRCNSRLGNVNIMSSKYHTYLQLPAILLKCLHLYSWEGGRYLCTLYPWPQYLLGVECPSRSVWTMSGWVGGREVTRNFILTSRRASRNNIYGCLLFQSIFFWFHQICLGMSTSWLRAKNQLTQNIHFDEYTMVKVGQGLSPTLK